MKLSENKDRKVSIRFSDSDFNYLSAVSFMTGMTVSKYIRTLCDATINAAKLSERQGKLNIEDFKTIFDN